MSFEAVVSQAALEAFAELGSVNGSDCKVYVDRQIEFVDEQGNVRYAEVLVHALKSAFPAWTRGDIITLNSGDVRLEQKLFDDGYVIRIEASPLESVPATDITTATAIGAFTVDGVLNTNDCKIILDRSVEVADEDGNIRHVRALVHAYKPGFPSWSSGDKLRMSQGHFLLHQRLYDDATVMRIEAQPVTNVDIYDTAGNVIHFVDGREWSHV